MQTVLTKVYEVRESAPTEHKGKEENTKNNHIN